MSTPSSPSPGARAIPRSWPGSTRSPSRRPASSGAPARSRSTPRPSPSPSRSSSRRRAAGPPVALYYRPTNPAFAAPDGERPPLLVLSHGGPTSNASTSLDLGKQLLTSRGIAVVDVDYGGSTGYGREYRRRLDGQWGVVDVDDCVAAARFLVERGDADPWRLAIEGGSAGGYTTLAALAFRDVFAAGISLFGIGDLALLETQPHKFESRYNHRLVGSVPGGGRPVSRALAELLHGPVLVPRAHPPGPRRQGRPAGPGGVDRGGADRQRDPPRVHRLRGRGPRLPRRLRHPAHHRSAAVVPGPGLRVRPGRPARAARGARPRHLARPPPPRPAFGVTEASTAI